MGELKKKGLGSVSKKRGIKGEMHWPNGARDGEGASPTKWESAIRQGKVWQREGGGVRRGDGRWGEERKGKLSDSKGN